MKKPGCHGCAYEWGNACNRHRVHFPSNDAPCQSCRRNPNRKELATGDHYKPLDQAFEEALSAGR